MKKVKLLTLLIILNIAAIFIVSINSYAVTNSQKDMSAFQNEPVGFKGHRWGSDLKSFGEMTFVSRTVHCTLSKKLKLFC